MKIEPRSPVLDGLVVNLLAALTLLCSTTVLAYVLAVEGYYTGLLAVLIVLVPYTGHIYSHTADRIEHALNRRRDARRRPTTAVIPLRAAPPGRHAVDAPTTVIRVVAA